MISNINVIIEFYDEIYKNVIFGKGYECPRFFGKCIFENCTFKHTAIRGVRFFNCTFKNCVFIKSAFVHCDFLWCNLKECDFTGAVFKGCDVQIDPKLAPTYPSKVPEKGKGFYGWKKVQIVGMGVGAHGIVKLWVPPDAERSSGLNGKCRASRVKTIGFYYKDPASGKTTKIDNSKIKLTGTSAFQPRDRCPKKYIPGTYTSSFKWDDDRFNECADGLHFFRTFVEADLY